MEDSFVKGKIDFIVEKFEKGELPKPQWTHTAHLIVAICYCEKYEKEEAVKILRNNIIGYNEAVGTPNTDSEGYHETLTRFWLLVARKFVERQEGSSLSDLCSKFISSRYADKTYPFKYYSRERLFSRKARHEWVDPDLAKLEVLL